jgi:hypothetical protein
VYVESAHAVRGAAATYYTPGVNTGGQDCPAWEGMEPRNAQSLRMHAAVGHI